MRFHFMLKIWIKFNFIHIFFFFRSLNIFHLVKEPFTIDQIIFQHHKRSKEIFSFIQSKIHLTSLLSKIKNNIIYESLFTYYSTSMIDKVSYAFDLLYNSVNSNYFVILMVTIETNTFSGFLLARLSPRNFLMLLMPKKWKMMRKVIIIRGRAKEPRIEKVVP